MYFIVYIVSIKRNVVVPYHWLREVRLHTEKFMNNGVNRNQQFRVFYTDDANAFDVNGLPRLSYGSNVRASYRSVFPEEGWYRCRIVKFKGNYRQIVSSNSIVK